MDNKAKNFQAFADEFASKLSSSRRWQAFMRIAIEMFALEGPVKIIETGCVRGPDSWTGDGASTRVFEWIAGRTKGAVMSVDLDPGACEIARKLCPTVSVYNDDSLRFLMRPEICLSGVDLLFLDSYDYNPPFADSELHHAGELAIAYPKLRSGALIAIDDCHTLDQGKHTLVRAFFERMEVRPIHESYIQIWRKP